MIRLYMIVAACAIAMSGATVKGIVRDAVTGEPLAGAEMKLWALGLSGESAADGSFDIGDVPVGRHPLTVERAGYVPVPFNPTLGPFSVVAPNGEAKPVVIRLERAATIRGTVRTEEGAPIPGATVSSITWQTDSYGPRGQAAETGITGSFVLNPVTPGPQQLTVSFPARARAVHGVSSRFEYGLQLVVVPGQEIDGIDIRVPFARVVAVSGRVVDPATDEPVQEGGVTLISEVDAFSRQSGTLHEGEFRFEGVLAGSYTLAILPKNSSSPDSPPFIHPLEVGPDGVSGLTVPRPPSASISGSVKRSFTDLDIRLWFTPKVGTGSGYADLDSEGRFVAEGLSPGRWTFGFLLSNHRHRRIPLEEPWMPRVVSMRQAGGELNGEVEIHAGKNPELQFEVGEYSRIRGIIIDQNGIGVREAYVVAKGPSGGQGTSSGAEGMFTIPAEPGIYEIQGLPPREVKPKKCDGNPVPVRVGTADVNGVRVVLCR